MKVGATRAYMLRRAKASVQEQWRREWKASVKEGHFAVANRFPPSLKPSRWFKDNPREVLGRLVQVQTGHGAFGEYYRRFHINEDIACPCGDALQTRVHILTECPLYEDYQYILRQVSRNAALPDILGTQAGVKALADFLSNSGAFTRSGCPHAPRTAPHFSLLAEQGDWGEEGGGGRGWGAGEGWETPNHGT